MLDPIPTLQPITTHLAEFSETFREELGMPLRPGQTVQDRRRAILREKAAEWNNALDSTACGCGHWRESHDETSPDHRCLMRCNCPGFKAAV
jgi:hypothetical protein